MMQVMIDMGFQVDASTAGSSVRFQPPDPAVRSISFHKRKCPAVCYPKHFFETNSSSSMQPIRRTRLIRSLCRSGVRS